jgi:nucleoside phosphorylase
MSSTVTRRVQHRGNFTIGWICQNETELAASKGMLDETYQNLPQDESDSNTYTLGSIGPHKVAIACCPSGERGADTAASVAKDLQRSFPNTRFCLMVGVGGGAPGHPNDDPAKDIHLGDVVVSQSGEGHGGVVQYDFGKTMKEGKFIKTRHLDKPPKAVMTTISKLSAHHKYTGSKIGEYISNMLESVKPVMRERFKYQGIEHDQLFVVGYDHMKSGKDCKSADCDERCLVTRKRRIDNDPVIHYGLIGSANNLIEHGATREKFRQEEGILCFETEAAGLMNNFECVVIRGISHYSDSHGNDVWLPYAAAAAAAYAKELLETLPVRRATMQEEPTQEDTTQMTHVTNNYLQFTHGQHPQLSRAATFSTVADSKRPLALEYRPAISQYGVPKTKSTKEKSVVSTRIPRRA